jgi:CheY-like chemotaxis protein
VKGSVMVVDDDEDIRESVADVLEDEGYDVDTVANGREALNLLAKKLPDRPDVMLVDVMMPVMDGWELLAELGRSPELSTIPAVLFTAQSSPPAETAGSSPRRATPVAAYLPKPLKIRDLLAMIQRFTS